MVEFFFQTKQMWQSQLYSYTYCSIVECVIISEIHFNSFIVRKRNIKGRHHGKKVERERKEGSWSITRFKGRLPHPISLCDFMFRGLSMTKCIACQIGCVNVALP